MCEIDSPYEIIELDEIPRITGEELPVYTEQELEKIIKTNSEGIIIFDMKTYLENIWKSYLQKKDKVLYQFKIDFPRQSFYINGSLISDADSFIKQLNMFNLKRCMDLIIEDLQLLTIMLCNQSSFELPFYLLNKIYTEENKQIFVTHTKKHDNIVKIISCPDHISFTFETTLRIINVIDEKEMYCVPIKLLFDIPDVADKIEFGVCNWELILKNKNLD